MTDFVHPEPFVADVVVDIDDVIEKKIDMYHQHTSQMYEWLPFNRGQLDQVPATEKERRIWLGKTWGQRSNAEPFRAKLIELYGKEKGSKIKSCEAFQDSGYGTRLTEREYQILFSLLLIFNILAVLLKLNKILIGFPVAIIEAIVVPGTI